MTDIKPLYIGLGNDGDVTLNPKYANRHGLIAGATGTGKTVTLQVMAEEFSRAGVPVFMADVKGDLSGMCVAGKSSPPLQNRIETLGLDDFQYREYPTVFWDLFGKQGHPIRTTISEMGPLLLARLMELNDTQEGVLNIAFRIADEQGLLLLDLKDLRAMLVWVSQNSKDISAEYGNVSGASVGAIQRRLLVLEQQGASHFFGEPALDIHDFMRTESGEGVINILAADKLIQSPRLYATVLLWLLSELFEEMPEVGDPDKPKLVFFFDEAHLLFNRAPRALVEKVEQVVRLIRSKGVGVYFVTQNPTDVPDAVLGQLGNRVQHALRAFTPRDQRAVRAAAETFRPNPAFDTRTAITEVGVGEALVSTLLKKGVPGIVQRTLIRPPQSRMGPATKRRRREVLDNSPLADVYDESVDRESAYEVLTVRAAEKAEAVRKPPKRRSYDDNLDEAVAPKKRRSSRGRQSVGEAMAKSLARSIGSSVGRRLIRGLLGSLFTGK